MIHNKIIIAFISCSIVISTEISAQKIITDRPDQAESPVTVPWKSIQLEAGFQLGHSNADQLSVREIQMPTMLLRYGLFKIVEIRIVDQFENLRIGKTSDGIYGLSDLELGTKIQILGKDNINTRIAFLSHLIIASGTRGISGERYGTVNKLAFANNMSEHFDLGYNIGFDYFGIGNGDFTWSVSLGIGLTEKTGGFIETYGDITNLKDPFVNMDAGLTYLIRDNLQIDCSFGSGLNNKMNFLSFGCSWNIKRPYPVHLDDKEK
jgi:hypothetical protein